MLSDVSLIIDLRAEREVKGGVFNDYGLAENSDYIPLLKNNRMIQNIAGDVPAQRYLVTSIIWRIFKRIANDFKLFLSGENAEILFLPHKMNNNDLTDAVYAIKQRNDMITSKGIRYVFVVVPSKQTIYSSDPDRYTLTYTDVLTENLREIGIETVSLVDEFRQHADIKLYRDFDTHWNERGVRVAAENIANHLGTTGY
jgi:hypothetical protein